MTEQKSNLGNKQLLCPECRNDQIKKDEIHGELICKNCGLVLKESLFDFGPEWRAFDKEDVEQKDRTGGLIKYAKLNKGLSTEIDKYDRDIRGQSIQPERKAQLYRLRKWQRHARMSDSMQRNLSIALPELNRMCSSCNLPENIKEECAILYRKAVQKGMIRGRSIESMIAAVIYLITKKHKLPATLEELEKYSGVEKREIGANYRFLCRKLNIPMPVTTPVDHIPKFASKLGLSGATEARAVEIIEKARNRGVTSGKGPCGVAAAAIYIAGKITGERFTQREIAQTLSETTEITIRNRADELSRLVEEDV